MKEEKINYILEKLLQECWGVFILIFLCIEKVIIFLYINRTHQNLCQPILLFQTILLKMHKLWTIWFINKRPILFSKIQSKPIGRIQLNKIHHANLKESKSNKLFGDRYLANLPNKNVFFFFLFKARHQRGPCHPNLASWSSNSLLFAYKQKEYVWLH